MAKQTMTVKKRIEIGTNKVKKLRQEGMLPVVVYGKTTEPIPVTLNLSELLKLYRNSAFGVNTIIEFSFENESTSKPLMVMAQDIIRHHITRDIQHADFVVVDGETILDIFVPVNFIGQSVGQKLGGILIRNKHQIRIKCKPGDIIPSIDVDVTDLDIGDFVKIADLNLGEGIDLQASDDALVVSCEAPKVEVTVEEDADEEGLDEDAVEGEDADASDDSSESDSDSSNSE